MFVLARHAHAGDKSAWSSDDSLRPLTRKGREQAAGLAHELGDWPLRRLLTSPYVRCRETLAPLSQRLGLAVESSDLLLPGADPDVLAGFLLDPAQEGTLVCAHGETLHALLARWDRTGEVAVPPGRVPGEPPVTKKGACWLVQDTGSGLTAHYLRPSQIVSADLVNSAHRHDEEQLPS
ncbi:phosphohistidine phosphatase SixA [Motilibacter peucedani]|uniref:Phosphohistidine phosphatase SixA n=1 Tax=Motilibacter peucedani TaxID=598650 RepID=A0A420XQI7_9ACTN|nr:phosphoglycerate mutase family protein [Motilibacter peucedani]RKS75507.1 phosphohistidine phosphatase SixA [Motilibacter peucedani]